MRHGNNKRKFGREKNLRNALMNSLALNLIVREKIKTTEPKAKELRPFDIHASLLALKLNIYLETPALDLLPPPTIESRSFRFGPLIS